MKSLLLGAAASLALASAANATTINGWYVSLEGGGNWIEDWDHTYAFPGTVPASASFDTGWAVLASVGYGFGGGWRAEFEAGYRDNEGDGGTFTLTPFPDSLLSWDVSEVSLMMNVLYDIPLTERMSLSLGAGAGADFAMVDHNFFGLPVEDDNWSFAYQGIAGLNYAIGQQTDLFVNYRYFRATEPEFDFSPVLGAVVSGDDVVKHTATIGLRYHFGAPAPAPAPVVDAPPPPPAEPEAPREFIVFFGHNKSNLTSEALTVIKQAADAAKQFGAAKITVVGHADRSGSDSYNQKLSLRRASAVKGALVTEGIAEGSISTSGRGESDPMVPTADGVREPQNRRVHISL
jgi:outer membrane protein OmpA-like peptidoglycan-associated protein